MSTYKIVRFRLRGTNRTIKRGLTLEEAQEHCNDPETSSSTCSTAKARRVPGIWFDGYSAEYGTYKGSENDPQAIAMQTIDNCQDVMDSRDVIDYLENLDPSDDEYRALAAFDAEGRDATTEWIDGTAIIRDSYFMAYAQDLAEDIGAIHKDYTWPTSYIDWESATRDLKYDYTQIEFDGVAYWVRSS